MMSIIFGPMSDPHSYSKPPGRRKRVVKDKDTRAREIIAAARKVFLKKGYSATTIDLIASEAKTAKGTIYIYYEGKDDLFVSLLVPLVRVIGDRLIQVEEDLDQGEIGSCGEIVRRLLDAHYQLFLTDPEGFSIFATFQAGFFSAISEKKLERLHEQGRRNFSAMRRILSKGQALGLIRNNMGVAVIADILWSAFFGMVMVEEGKRRITKKDHMYTTLIQACGLLSQALCTKNQTK